MQRMEEIDTLDGKAPAANEWHQPARPDVRGGCVLRFSQARPDHARMGRPNQQLRQV
jgi:hypothetical protein